MPCFVLMISRSRNLMRFTLSINNKVQKSACFKAVIQLLPGLIVLLVYCTAARAMSPEPLSAVVLKGTLKTVDARQVYRRKNDAETYYSLHSSHSTTTSYFSIDGEAKAPETETSNSLPDTSTGEFDRVAVKNTAGGDVLLVTDFRGKFDDGSFTRVTIEAPVIFLDGDYQQYLAGEQVKVQYTEAGFRKLLDEAERKINETMMPVLKDAAIYRLKWKLDGFSVDIEVSSEVKIASMPNNPIVMDKQSLVLDESGETIIHFAVLAKAFPKQEGNTSASEGD